jgi:hypothetical protein
MSNATLVIGESGTGKSTSLRNLDEKETFIINVLDKPLPFKGFRQRYIKVTKEGGNYFVSDDYSKILSTIKFINDNRPDIKNIIIDDYQYIMANEFMRRAIERGFDKFTEIGQHAWKIIDYSVKCRDDLFFFFLSHSELYADGKVKCKTIGKMIDDKITLEGMFTTVLHTIVMDGKYKFITQNDGTHIAKSPMGMFDSIHIDNDLFQVKSSMHNYYFGDKQ